MQVGRSISIVFGTALLIAAAVVSNCQAMVRLPDSFSDAMGKTNVFLSISVGTNGDEQAAYSPAALTNALNELSKNVAIQSLSIEIESLCGDYDFPLQWICGLTNLVELAIYGRGSQRVSISIRRNVLPSTIENLQILDVFINDATPVSELTSLHELTINTIFPLEVVNEQLQSLSMWDVRENSTCDLSRFVNLKSLSLVDVSFDCIVGIESANKLENLTISGTTGLDSLELPKSPWLKTLSLSGGHFPPLLKETKQLARYQLESLQLRYLPIRKVEGIGTGTLKSLVVDCCPISSLSDICDLPVLEYLDVRQTGISVVDKEVLRRRFPRLKRLEYTDSHGDSVDLEILTAGQKGY